MIIKTALIAGKEIPEIDKDIIRYLLVEEVNPGELEILVQDNGKSEKATRQLGIYNAKQEIYRVLSTSSESQLNNAIEELEELGLTSIPGAEGFYAVFTMEE